MPKFLLLFISSCFCFVVGFSQTGPGGVGDNTTNHLWIDATVSCLNGNLDPAVAGEGVKRLLDLSGNNNFMNQSNSSRYGTLNANQINGRSVVRFDGINDQYDGNLSAGVLSEIDIFTVGNFALPTQPAGVGSAFYLLGNANNNSVNFLRRNANAGVDVDKYYSRVEGVNRIGEFVDNSVHLYSQRFESSAPFHFFNVDGNAQTVAAHNSIVTVSSALLIGAVYSSNSNNLNGDIAELIVFEGINRTQRIIVENYLAAKYNLAMTGSDFYAHKAGHGNDVAGIGQVSATDNHTDSRGQSIVQINNADDLEDGEYMLWGHDGAGLGVINTDVPNPAFTSTGGERIAQEWRVDITGGDLSVGTFDISFDLTGNTFGVDPTGYRLLVDTDNDGNFINASVNAAVPIVVGSTVTFENVTLSDGNYFTIGNDNNIETCIALITGNWSDPGGAFWVCSTLPPDSTKHVEITDGVTVRIIAGSEESANNLRLEADGGGGGAALIMDANSTLIILGDLNIEAGTSITMDVGSRIIFRGINGNQTILNSSGSALSFANLEVNNVNGATLFPADYEISENLDLLNGNLTNNGNLTFLSTAANTAAIGPTPNGNILDGSGSFIVHRFRSTRNTNWGDITTSGVDTDLEDLNGEVFMSGIAGGNGYASNASGGGSFTSVYFWDAVADVYVVPASTAEPFEIGRGYEIWLGDNQTTWNDQFWILEGDVDLSPISIPVNSSAGNNWNLLGNPYLGFLNFDNIDAAGGINGNEYWYVDANSSAFVSVPVGGATIPPGQGFWVSTTGLTSIDLDPSLDLVTGVTSSTYFKRDTRKDELKIMAQHNKEAIGSAVYLRRSDDAYEGLDEYDLSPLRLPDPKAPKLSIEAGASDLMVNYIPTYADQIEIPVRFETGMEGEYTLSFEGLDQFEGYSCASIRNDQTDDITSISEESLIAMNTSNGTSAHYTLILTKDGSEDCQPEEGSVSLLDDEFVKIWNTNTDIIVDFSLDQSAPAQISIYDALGNLVQSDKTTANFNRETYSMTSLTSGVYFITVNINGQSWTQKTIKY